MKLSEAVVVDQLNGFCRDFEIAVWFYRLSNLFGAQRKKNPNHSTTPPGFEPGRANPSGVCNPTEIGRIAAERLNHSAKVSSWGAPFIY